MRLIKTTAQASNKKHQIQTGRFRISRTWWQQNGTVAFHDVTNQGITLGSVTAPARSQLRSQCIRTDRANTKHSMPTFLQSNHTGTTMATGQNSLAAQARKCYRDLIIQFCKIVHLPDPEAMVEQCRFTVNDVLFTLAHSGDEMPDQAVLVANFGAPPTEKSEEAIRKLLEINSFTFSDPGCPSFVIQPDTGNVMLMQRIALLMVSAEGLRILVENVAQHANAWRQTFYLNTDEKSKTATA